MTSMITGRFSWIFKVFKDARWKYVKRKQCLLAVNAIFTFASVKPHAF